MDKNLKKNLSKEFKHIFKKYTDEGVTIDILFNVLTEIINTIEHNDKDNLSKKKIEKKQKRFVDLFCLYQILHVMNKIDLKYYN